MDHETRKKLNAVSCADNSCVFGSPLGQGTNGGCHCSINDLSIKDRRNVRQGIKILRDALEATEEKLKEALNEINILKEFHSK